MIPHDMSTPTIGQRLVVLLVSMILGTAALGLLTTVFTFYLVLAATKVLLALCLLILSFFLFVGGLTA